MSDLTPANLDYFETDQVRLAVHLWKANKKAKGADFDVLKFAQQWAYADVVIKQALLSDDDAVARGALELMQLRLRFVATYPARALAFGAVIDPVTSPASAAKSDPAPPKRAYLKGVR
ncbi:MAG: hypothetical protein ACI8WM_002513 [Burkholderiaceae bacterium]|jgi:hypothetical protein